MVFHWNDLVNQTAVIPNKSVISLIFSSLSIQVLSPDLPLWEKLAELLEKKENAGVVATRIIKRFDDFVSALLRSTSYCCLRTDTEQRELCFWSLWMLLEDSENNKRCRYDYSLVMWSFSSFSYIQNIFKNCGKNVNNVERTNKENVTAPDTREHTTEVIRDGLNESSSLSTTTYPRCESSSQRMWRQHGTRVKAALRSKRYQKSSNSRSLLLNIVCLWHVYWEFSAQ